MKINEIVLIGNGNMHFIKGFIENVIDTSESIVTVFSPEIWDEENKRYYLNNKVEILSNKVKYKGKNVLLRKIHTVKSIYRNSRKVWPDVVHVFDVKTSSALLALLTLKKNSKLVVTFFGSDLLVSKPNILLRLLVRRADAITVSVEKLYNKFAEAYGTKYIDKVQLAKIGDPILEYMKEHANSLSRACCKKTFGILEEKVVIVIGYNGNVEQQHIKVIKALKGLADEEINRVFIIIQAGYGLPEGYLEQIQCELQGFKGDSLILTDFLNYEQITYLKAATDIYIHARTTDAFSASLQENLYYNNYSLIGSWLNYNELNTGDYNFDYFSEFEEIPKKVTEFINSGVLNKEIKTRSGIYELSSWASINNDWRTIYDNLF